MKVIIVEDDEFKLDKIKDFFRDQHPTAEVTTVKAVMPAMRTISSASFDFAVIDMSLPTYEVTAVEPGGRPQVFGGKEILRYIERKRINIQVVVLTQFEMFGKGDEAQEISDLGEELFQHYPRIFLGIIYFEHSGKWRDQLMEKLGSVIDG